MNAYTGALTCQAADFVFKADKTAAAAWQDIQAIPHIRAAVCDNKKDFLAGLLAWNNRKALVSSNAFLGIYAHMGQPGLSPRGSKDPELDRSQIVTWAELAQAIPRRVHTLWLVGCQSCHVRDAWPAKAGPVRGRLLATTKNAAWLPLVQFFADEISMYPPRFNDQMLSHLREDLKKQNKEHLAEGIEYYVPTKNGWKKESW